MTEGNGRGVGGEGYKIHIINILPISLTLLPYMGEGNEITLSGANWISVLKYFQKIMLHSVPSDPVSFSLEGMN